MLQCFWWKPWRLGFLLWGPRWIVLTARLILGTLRDRVHKATLTFPHQVETEKWNYYLSKYLSAWIISLLPLIVTPTIIYLLQRQNQVFTYPWGNSLCCMHARAHTHTHTHIHSLLNLFIILLSNSFIISLLSNLRTLSRLSSSYWLLSLYHQSKWNKRQFPAPDTSPYGIDAVTSHKMPDGPKISVIQE